jgi:hypothetical protein
MPWQCSCIIHRAVSDTVCEFENQLQNKSSQTFQKFFWHLKYANSQKSGLNNFFVIKRDFFG